jgi:hypothetical protein
MRDDLSAFDEFRSAANRRRPPVNVIAEIFSR